MFPVFNEILQIFGIFNIKNWPGNCSDTVSNMTFTKCLNICMAAKFGSILWSGFAEKNKKIKS
jgi:hypothetical protein